MLPRRALIAAGLAAAATPVVTMPAFALQSWPQFLAGVRVEARRRGVSEATLDAALGHIEPIPRVIELDAHQPEFEFTWDQYRTRIVSQKRIADGRAHYLPNRALLTDIEQRYGVPAGILVGIWGLESNYGASTGGFNVIQSLATLAYEGRRTAFFRSELIDALRIAQTGVPAARMTGSYAGAMGQTQFMPDSFLRYAVPWNGGSRDIWSDLGSVFASTANYLAREGWRPGIPWGEKVRAPAGVSAYDVGRDHRRPAGDWARMGVTRADGRPLSVPPANRDGAAAAGRRDGTGRELRRLLPELPGDPPLQPGRFLLHLRRPDRRRRHRRMSLLVRGALALACLASLSGCGLFRHRRPPAAVAVHTVVGAPYASGGFMEYPRAQFEYDATGLAVVQTRHGPATADGAPWSDVAMVASHPTLQLPSVARVTNLETGREVLVRLDDRGPGVAGRLLGVSPRVAALLGPGSEPGVLRVRVRIDEALSRALTAQNGEPPGETVAIAAAPRAGVSERSLAPPPGVASGGGRAAFAGPAVAAAATAPASAVPLRLPEQVTTVPPRPGALYVEAGVFSRPDYARLLVARLAGEGAQLSTSYNAPRDEAYRVRIGPLPTAAAADAMLDRTRRAGVSGARILVD